MIVDVVAVHVVQVPLVPEGRVLTARSVNVPAVLLVLRAAHRSRASDASDESSLA
jgi:hypothetical protein